MNELKTYVFVVDATAIYTDDNPEELKRALKEYPNGVIMTTEEFETL